MCGIFFYKGKLYKTDDLTYYVEKLHDRGPDNKKIVQVSDDIILGFTRLCINDLSENGDQPFHKNGIYLICNGEIYNFKQLIDENKFQMNSSSDCEVIIDLYLKYGLKETCKQLDGVFSFVIVDTIQNKVYVARDRFGVRPGYIGRTETNEILVASELKAISDLCTYIEPFQPGNFLELSNDSDELFKYQPYYRYLYNIIENDEETLKKILENY